MSEKEVNAVSTGATNLARKFSLINDHWNPKIVGELNNNYVKVAKFIGEFMWHSHENEDEMFLVTKGALVIMVRDPTEMDVTVKEGEFFIVPRGVEHKPVAAEKVHVMLFEPKTVLNTGDKVCEKTVEKLEWI